MLQLIFRESDMYTAKQIEVQEMFAILCKEFEFPKLLSDAELGTKRRVSFYRLLSLCHIPPPPAVNESLTQNKLIKTQTYNHFAFIWRYYHLKERHGLLSWSRE
jgi:hypothetical protein